MFFAYLLYIGIDSLNFNALDEFNTTFYRRDNTCKKPKINEFRLQAKYTNSSNLYIDCGGDWCKILPLSRRGGRVVECTSLEN